VCSITIEKRHGQYCTVHCHGSDKGKSIACFDTEKEALDQHRAIEASKHAKKIEIDINEL
jgi:hypothetical protein